MNVMITKCPEWVMAEETENAFELSARIYLDRVEMLRKKMIENNLDFVIVYGDREHFANIEYFTRYDCRFEESLFILSANNEKTIVVGNEGEGYSYIIPYEIKRSIYKHFSLQGQPKEGSKLLSEIFRDAGIDKYSSVGIVGNKYFEWGSDEVKKYRFDLPEYIVYELNQIVSPGSAINFTQEITGLPNGIRMTLHSAEEVAFVESQARKSANVIRRLLKHAKPGITETELATYSKSDLSPTQMFSLINLSPESVALGLRSPSPYHALELGGVFGLCYSLRGSLCSKVGVAAYSQDTVKPELKDKIFDFYMKHWGAVASWLETVSVGVVGGELYDSVMNIIGDPKFGVTLNPGHFIGMDEWTNSSSFKHSTIPLLSGSALQTDIIASSKEPIMTSICEDTVIIADKKLRDQIKEEYPEVFERIEKRQEFIKSELNLQISDDLLPMSNMVGVMFPYMLNTGLMYTKG